MSKQAFHDTPFLPWKDITGRSEDSVTQIRRMTLGSCPLEKPHLHLKTAVHRAPSSISLLQPGYPSQEQVPVPLFSCTMFGHLCPSCEACPLCLVPKFLQVSS